MKTSSQSIKKIIEQIAFRSQVKVNQIYMQVIINMPTYTLLLGYIPSESP